MASSKQLPEWVAVLQALLVPVIAAVGAFIAWQQMQFSRIRLQHDLYDRRFAIFRSTEQMLMSVAVEGRVSDDVFLPFAAGVGAARFVFDGNLSEYLLEVLKHAIALQRAQSQLRGLPACQSDPSAVDTEAKELTWLVEQGRGLGDRFRPFLQFDRRWTLSWRQILGRMGRW